MKRPSSHESLSCWRDTAKVSRTGPKRAGGASKSPPWQGIGLFLLCLLLAGCAKTRSISNSDANAGLGLGCGGGVRAAADPGYEYRGELNEFDVLGVDRARVASDEEIARALAQAGSVELKPHSRVLLIQSGAVFP